MDRMPASEPNLNPTPNNGNGKRTVVCRIQGYNVLTGKFGLFQGNQSVLRIYCSTPRQDTTTVKYMYVRTYPHNS